MNESASFIMSMSIGFIPSSMTMLDTTSCQSAPRTIICIICASPSFFSSISTSLRHVYSKDLGYAAVYGDAEHLVGFLYREVVVGYHYELDALRIFLDEAGYLLRVGFVQRGVDFVEDVERRGAVLHYREQECK